MQYYTENHPALNRPVPEFRPNDLKHATVTKANADEDVGLVLERKGKQFYIKQIKPGTIFLVSATRFGNWADFSVHQQ